MPPRTPSLPWTTAFLAAVVTTAATWILACPSEAQTFRTTEDVLLLRELGAGIEPGEDGLAVGLVMPAEARPEGYREVDLAVGDVVMVINGQRVRDIAKAEEIYDATAIGAEITLGVMRGGQSRVVRFAKADPASLPQTMRFEGGGGHGGGTVQRMVFRSDDGNAPVAASGIGVLLEDDGEAVKVALVLPDSRSTLAEGDLILSVGGRKPASAQEVADAIEAMEVGAKVELEVERDGEALRITTEKSRSRATFIMRREG